MARQRRGGGFRPPELRGTLGTLLRTTLAQAGTLRDALERGAREGRSRLDSALSGRRRQDALAELGEIVLELVRRGEIDLDELPEARDLVAQLDEIDAAEGEEYVEEPAAAPRSRRDEDGTVSAASWSRPTKVGRPSARPAAPAPRRAEPRVWRPPADSAPARPDDEITMAQRPISRAEPKDPTRKGGIHFDDDEDLAEYMHPDDVPPKSTPDGDA